MIEHGCQCDAFEATAPGVGPTRWHRFLRRLYNYAWNNKMSDARICSEDWRLFA
jgi:hypothetical protein